MSLEVILGPMFAGKSSEILSRVRKAKVLGWKPLVITNSIDTRYDLSGCQIVTHDKASLQANGVKGLLSVLNWESYKEAQLIIVEEGQFFPDLLEFCKVAVEMDKKDVVVVGLSGDSDRRPFGQILDLIPLTDSIVHLKALCKRCGDGTPALFSALVRGQKTGQVFVGGADSYEPMCRRHYLANSEGNMI
jgi:thymidine kinase